MKEKKSSYFEAFIDDFRLEKLFQRLIQCAITRSGGSSQTFAHITELGEGLQLDTVDKIKN
jgi:hypothetical protein